MQLTKYRAFGKSRFIQMAVSLLSMLIYWGFSSGIFEILFNYNESSIDYNAQKAEQVRHDMLESSMYLSEYMNIQGYTTTIMFILMLAVLILFYQEKNGLFTFHGDYIPLVVMAVSALVMAGFVYLIEKKGKAWVDSFSIAGSMIIGMTAAVLVGLL